MYFHSLTHTAHTTICRCSPICSLSAQYAPLMLFTNLQFKLQCTITQTITNKQASIINSLLQPPTPSIMINNSFVFFKEFAIYNHCQLPATAAHAHPYPIGPYTFTPSLHSPSLPVTSTAPLLLLIGCIIYGLLHLHYKLKLANATENLN